MADVAAHTGDDGALKHLRAYNRPPMSTLAAGSAVPSPPSTRLSIASGVLVAAVGVLVVSGWIWNIQAFKSVYGPITMKTNTGIGLMLVGSALILLRRYPRVAAACAVVAGAIGAATLAEHLFAWNLGIDQLVAVEAPGAAATDSPNRMGLNASSSFVMLGAALLLLARGTARAARTAQALALVVLLPTSLALVGYMYGTEQLYGIARYTGIALHTAIALGVAAVGVLAARVDVPPVAVFLGDGPAGTLLRRLTLPTLVIPAALGYLAVLGRRTELVDRGLAIALLTVSLTVLLGLTIWHTAKVIHRSDTQRRAAERRRHELIQRERRARDEAERANRMKDEFIATLSHELRTPLNVMLGWTRILEMRGEGGGHTNAAAIVARNGRLLARLVEDLLDLSRVSTGQFEITRRPMRLNAVVQSTIEALAPTAAARKIAIISELAPDDAAIDADGERVQQIVWNLLSNAVKFTGDGGCVQVRIDRRDAVVVLTVSDNGIGFDASFAAELFTPFRQADTSLRREHGGLGLGLSIARSLAELHGGSLVGSSAGLGHGATFVLTLPAMGSIAPTVELSITDPGVMLQNS
jgi:signal transduction histidine kinase